jgi:hypothetical protein
MKKIIGIDTKVLNVFPRFAAGRCEASGFVCTNPYPAFNDKAKAPVIRLTKTVPKVGLTQKKHA